MAKLNRAYYTVLIVIYGLLVITLPYIVYISWAFSPEALELTSSPEQKLHIANISLTLKSRRGNFTIKTSVLDTLIYTNYKYIILFVLSLIYIISQSYI